ncbi:hypothetical protein OCJ37_03230 [Xanthomonas sp. AM6]|uniref:hypothetical protein n=1 Tax=Xanthomonas sp. AM6 TaxID=2982531 RepID=UPI0021D9FBA8|nr:hypothetical protein [Xanthomonas sp. AM6]UYB52990.1 hypothetical protein OCJ37_03230 [Xanthomonas sp. AM6]
MGNPALSAAVATLERRAARASAEDVAAAIVQVWQQMDDALTPILGARGVAALLRRTLFVCKDHFPWLAETYAASEISSDRGVIDVLRRVLAEQPAPAAAAGGGALLHSFHDLLVGMIGTELTERLLRPVWTPLSAATPAQDISP